MDLAEQMLTIWRSKLGKSRQVPLHETTTAVLAAYAARRDQLCPRPATASFFLSGGGTRLNHTNTSTTFAGLLEAAGIATPPGRRPPAPPPRRGAPPRGSTTCGTASPSPP